VIRTAKKLIRGKHSERHRLVGRPEQFQEQRAWQFTFLKDQGLEPWHRFLEIGCGVLTVGVPIIDYLEPHRYVGIDARGEVLDGARQELAEAGLTSKTPELILASDPSEVAPLPLCDRGCAFKVLLHMPDETVGAYLRYVARQVTGPFFATALIGDLPVRHWQGFPVISRPLSFFEDIAGIARLQATDMGTLDQFGEAPRANQGHMLRFDPV
jgi:SAM-dependent methyltransferase